MRSRIIREELSACTDELLYKPFAASTKVYGVDDVLA